VQVTAVAHGDGLVYAGLTDGTVGGYPEHGGDMLCSTSTPTGKISGLTYANGVLYASGDPHLVAFDAATGVGPWRWPRQKVERGANPQQPASSPPPQ
jgi:outer membrane protein assembly factor BamB